MFKNDDEELAQDLKRRMQQFHDSWLRAQEFEKRARTLSGPSLPLERKPLSMSLGEVTRIRVRLLSVGCPPSLLDGILPPGDRDLLRLGFKPFWMR